MAKHNAYTHQEDEKQGNRDNCAKARHCKYQKCGFSFIPTRRWQVFHTPGCHDAYWRELREMAGKLSQEGNPGLMEPLNIKDEVK